MFHWIMAAGFQNVVEANHVALDVSIRVGDGVPHACLRAKIDHDIRVVLLENAVDRALSARLPLMKV